MVSRRLAMDSITPMYDTASRKKSSGRSETVLLANCGETSCKVKKSFMCAATSMIYCTSKMAKLVRWFTHVMCLQSLLYVGVSYKLLTIILSDHEMTIHLL